MWELLPTRGPYFINRATRNRAQTDDRQLARCPLLRTLSRRHGSVRASRSAIRTSQSRCRDIDQGISLTQFRFFPVRIRCDVTPLADAPRRTRLTHRCAGRAPRSTRSGFRGSRLPPRSPVLARRSAVIALRSAVIGKGGHGRPETVPGTRGSIFGSRQLIRGRPATGAASLELRFYVTYDRREQGGHAGPRGRSAHCKSSGPTNEDLGHVPPEIRLRHPEPAAPNTEPAGAPVTPAGAPPAACVERARTGGPKTAGRVTGAKPSRTPARAAEGETLKPQYRAAHLVAKLWPTATVAQW
jgi:hypothetical protein